MTARRRPAGVLVAVDGLSGTAVKRAARRLVSADGGDRAGVSWWDASGIFGELEASGGESERASVRTLLLLYAADLAFRVRWEIRPALAEGRRIIAAPYVDTAVAFGRGAGLDEGWLHSLFNFAPVPEQHVYVDHVPAAAGAGDGFVELACRQAAETRTRAARQELIDRTVARLTAARRRAAGSSAKRSRAQRASRR